MLTGGRRRAWLMKNTGSAVEQVWIPVFSLLLQPCESEANGARGSRRAGRAGIGTSMLNRDLQIALGAGLRLDTGVW